MPITKRNIAAGVPDMTSNQLWRYRRGQQQALEDISGRGRRRRGEGGEAGGGGGAEPPTGGVEPIPGNLTAPVAPNTNPQLQAADASTWGQQWQRPGTAPISPTGGAEPFQPGGASQPQPLSPTGVVPRFTGPSNEQPIDAAPGTMTAPTAPGGRTRKTYGAPNPGWAVTNGQFRGLSNIIRSF